MISRRRFLGSALAASALGWVGLRRRAGARPSRPATVAFYPPGPGPDLPGAFARLPGTPEEVEIGSLRVGHFHGLTRERDGRVAYLYEATVIGPRPRRGLVKLGEPAIFPVA